MRTVEYTERFNGRDYPNTVTVFTLDELIERLTALRGEHGGEVAVACLKDSADSVHPLDGLGAYSVEPWGPTVVLSIND